MREVEVGGAPHRRRPDRLHHALGVRGDLRRRRQPRFRDHVTLRRAEVLARHAWTDGSRLDLFADIERSADAIGAFAGPAEAQRYRHFCAEARRIYDTLEQPFIRAPQPSLAGLVQPPGCAGLAICGGSSRSRRCGARSATTSTIRACASCSAATPPIAARRPSRRRRR